MRTPARSAAWGNGSLPRSLPGARAVPSGRDGSPQWAPPDSRSPPPSPQTVGILRLEDPYGTFAPELLSQLSAAAREYRQEQLICRCPFASDGTIEHLFLPALRLGFVTSNHFHTFPG